MKIYNYSKNDLVKNFYEREKLLSNREELKEDEKNQVELKSIEVKLKWFRSEFDDRLLIEWKKAMDIGLFKFKLDQLPTRFLPGKYLFIAQVNPLRYSEKRPSEIKKSSLNLPFDKNKFNFTKINKNEILFKIVNENTAVINNEDDENLLIINNSPIELGHFLILPQVKQLNNQVLNKYAMSLGIEVMQLTGSLNFLLGFNSLNAYASVNNLHLQGYYLENDVINKREHFYPIPVQNIQRAEHLNERLWFITDEDYFFPGFALQLCDFNEDIYEFSENIFVITNYLNKNEIPHNLICVNSPVFKCKDRANCIMKNCVEKNVAVHTIRAIIWPKKSSDEIEGNQRKVNFAICELSGHFIMTCDDDFDGITEEFIVKVSEDAKLNETQLIQIKKDLLKTDMK